MAAGEPLGPRERLRLLDLLGQAVIATDLSGVVTYWNDAAERVYGWSAPEAVGRDIADLTVPRLGQDLGAQIMAQLAKGESWSGGFTVQRKDGSLFTALVTDATVVDDAGEAVGIVGVSINLGEMLRPLLVASREVVVVTDEHGAVRFASPAVERLLGIQAEDLPGRLLADLTHPDDRAVLARAAERSHAGWADHPGDARPDVRMRHEDGSWIWVEGLVANVLEEPSVRGLVWSFRDVSERRLALDRMTDIALHDELTGLPNRALLRDRLDQLTARRHPHGAVLFVDLDGFKQVNDELGHAAGDQLLRTVADRLTHLVRPEDSCGRWAGDEFLVLSESVATEQAARMLAERVEHALAQPLELSDRVVRIRTSIGVAMLVGRDPEVILRLADERMYEVKQKHHRTGQVIDLR
jgi:diguanylate cyclase (GGDEF)-like protein/PAS domain S-box-containing protein